MKIQRTWRFVTLLILIVNAAFADNAQNTQAIRDSVQQIYTSNSQPILIHGISLAEPITRFYEQRQFTPAWSDPILVDKLLDALASTATDGLNPEDYHLSELKKMRTQSSASAAQVANFDLLATDAYLRALINLFRGKVDPTSLDPVWNFEDNKMAPGQALPLITAAVDHGTIAELFAQARPHHPFYSRLQKALAELRALSAQGGWPQLPDGPTLKPGMRDPRVLLLRQRLLSAGNLSNADMQNDIYDKNLSTAVAQFQRDQYLSDDGAIGPATRAALNISTATRIDQIRVNLERARWLLHDVPETFVLVDVAGYRVTYFKNGNAVWKSKVQVGKPYRSTPIFKSTINYITLNPTWTVPPTILRNDILPKVRKNINYLASHNIRVLNRNGEIIDATKVDWRNPGNIMLRQDASPDGALGLAVIRFPNDHAVFLHDTPHKELFAKNKRDFSSGCIRVENVLKLVELLLADTPSWDKAAIEKELAGGKTRNASLSKSIPILLAYWTVNADESEHIAFKPDIYDRDSRLLKALNKI